MKRLILLCALAVSGLPLIPPALAGEPSFDCAAATQADEQAICGDTALADLESLAAEGYVRTKDSISADAANGIAGPALAARHACGGYRACIMGVLTDAIDAYDDAMGYAPGPHSVMNGLIADWQAANETCRGSSDPAATDQACAARDDAARALHGMGLCEGKYSFDDPNFDMATVLRDRWIPCTYTDLRD